MQARGNTDGARNVQPYWSGDPDRADLLPILERLGRVREIAFGERLWSDTSADRNLYLIESGALKLSLVTPKGEELVVGLFFEGDVMGWQGLADAPDADVAMALEPTRVRALPLTQIEELCRHDQLLHRQIMRLASQRIAQLQQRMLVVAKSSATERVAGFLLELANRRAAADGWQHLPMSLEGIGCYLGLSLETVSRSLSRLERDGVILKRGRSVQVLDRDRLIATAGEAGTIADYRRGHA